MARCANLTCGSSNADYEGGFCDLCASLKVTIKGKDYIVEPKMYPNRQDKGQLEAYRTAANLYKQLRRDGDTTHKAAAAANPLLNLLRDEAAPPKELPVLASFSDGGPLIYPFEVKGSISGRLTKEGPNFQEICKLHQTPVNPTTHSCELCHPPQAGVILLEIKE